MLLFSLCNQHLTLDSRKKKRKRQLSKLCVGSLRPEASLFGAFNSDIQRFDCLSGYSYEFFGFFFFLITANKSSGSWPGVGGRRNSFKEPQTGRFLGNPFLSQSWRPPCNWRRSTP